MRRISEPARQAAVEALVAKSLTETDRGQAQIAVNLQGKFLPKVKVTDWGYMPLPSSRTPLGGYQGGNRPGGSDVSEYEERTLTIEIFDNRTKEVIWVGWSKRDATAEVDVERVKATIRRILSEFPPGSTNHR
jgi:hypothetical protein